MIRRRRATGDCFRKALDTARDLPPGAKVVHAVVIGTGPIEGVAHVHAWAELGGSVFDFSNGRSWVGPADVYVAAARVGLLVRYTLDRALELALATGHYGPWDPELLAHEPEPVRQSPDTCRTPAGPAR